MQACCYATVLWKPVIALVSVKLSEHLYRMVGSQCYAMLNVIGRVNFQTVHGW